jgi:hypothetical protein
MRTQEGGGAQEGAEADSGVYTFCGAARGAKEEDGREGPAAMVEEGWEGEQWGGAARGQWGAAG